MTDEEAKRQGLMPNGRPVPKRVDNSVIDFWEASEAARNDFMSKYTPVVSDQALAITWAVVAAYHNQFPSCTCSAGNLSSGSKDTKTAEHRAADEFARLWKKVKGPKWSDANGAKYAALLQVDKKAAKEYVHEFKRKWVEAYKDVINAAAVYFKIPNYLLGGIAYNEVGGDPPSKDDVAYIARLIEGGLSKALTVSFGPVQMQLRVAAYMLGYKKGVGSQRAEQIAISLRDPAFNLFVVAKYIREVHDSPRPWGDAEERYIAAHYNGGPSGWRGEAAQRYAKDYMTYRPWVRSVLGPGGKVAN